MLQTDYLVIGAGAAGMAITDALLTHSDATVTIVDRRHAPGGHWIDAYPYVRLHQPSTFYGVDSTPLGDDAIDRTGWNAGFHGLATADDIRSYYGRVMEHRFLASGRVRYLPCSDHVGDQLGDQRVVSRLTGATKEFRVARKVIDTTYVEGSIPATTAPPFDVADGVRWGPPGAIAHLDRQPDDFVVIGAGKTAVDTCVWLIEHGVAPAAIRWVKPRESWWLNRRFFQPHDGIPEVYRGLAIQLEALAQASSLEELYARLEAERFALRVDTTVTPTMCRGAIISEAELEMVRRIDQVIRLGHVRTISTDTLTLDQGAVPTGARTLHIHCAAPGLPQRPLRPMFEPGRITVQPFMWGFACFQFAMLGVAEALIGDDDEKNRLFPPIAYWDAAADYVSAFGAGLNTSRDRAAHPALANWAKRSRLNLMAGGESHGDHPTMIEARDRIRRHGAAAALAVRTLAGVSAPRR